MYNEIQLYIILERDCVSMEERRKSKRTELRSKLLVKRLDNGKFDEVNVEVDNVSKTGIGFCCDELLEIGAVYESYLTIWPKEVIHAFIEIVRIEREEDGFQYGGLFIGMPEIDLQRIGVYNVVSEADKYRK